MEAKIFTEDGKNIKEVLEKKSRILVGPRCYSCINKEW